MAEQQERQGKNPQSEIKDKKIAAVQRSALVFAKS